jgi:hypothetical protein
MALMVRQVYKCRSVLTLFGQSVEFLGKRELLGKAANNAHEIIRYNQLA